MSFAAEQIRGTIPAVDVGASVLVDVAPRVTSDLARFPTQLVR